MNRVFLAIACVFLCVGLASAKEVSPEDVVELDAKPKSCKFLGLVNYDKGKYLRWSSNRGVYEAALKGIREKTADLGGDAFFVVHRESNNGSGLAASGVSVEANAYLCGTNKVEKKATGSREPRSEPEKKRTPLPDEQSSRVKAPAVLLGEYMVSSKLGLAYNVGVGIGFEGLKRIRKNFYLGVEHLFASGEYTGDEKNVSDRTEDSGTVKSELQMDFDLHELGVKGRWFPFNSGFAGFNVSGGLSYDHLNGKIGYNITREVFLVDDEEFFGRHYTANALVLQVGAANYWQFRFGLYVGADWLTLSVPLYARVDLSGSDEDLNSEYISDSERDNLDDKGRSALNSLFVVKSMAVAGWRF